MNTQTKTAISYEPLGKLGTLTTRLAANKSEIKQAQRIRYQVFCNEMSAQKSLRRILSQRDADGHDKYCDHLLVFDEMLKSEPIVGTQRLYLGKCGQQNNTFYSQSEFDLLSLTYKFSHLQFMELGRSCILQAYRSKRTMELLWHGTWAYALENNVDVMVGCASFEETDIEKIKPALGFLSKHAKCKKEWDIETTDKPAFSIVDFECDALDEKSALHTLPPLIKGYLRVGAKFATKAVLDEDFGTIDLLVILNVKDINPRYINYFGADASKHRIS